MDTLITTVVEYAPFAHFLIFGFLMLGGLNVPISEDVMLIIGGVVASTCVPENTTILWVWLYFGCILSAWEAYWLGRLLGPKLYHITWFKRVLNRTRMQKLNHFYEKYGVLTFFVGRYIPGGVRNCLFMTAGMGPMPFGLFILRDSIACLFSTTTLFYLGYQFGEHRELLLSSFKAYQNGVLLCLGFFIILFFAYRYYKYGSVVRVVFDQSQNK